ncbi:UNVERIFIED_CONTAM: hypothetical protein RMT77_019931 [Armadillidium vulgare]
MKIKVWLLLFNGGLGREYQYDLFYNYTLSSSDTVEYKVYNACECRNRCFVRPTCLAFTLVQNKDGWSCRYFINGSQAKYSFVKEDGVLFFYQRDAYGTLEPDGLFYFNSKVIRNLLPDSRQVCEQFPNYQLAYITSVLTFKISLKHCYRCDEKEGK